MCVIRSHRTVLSFAASLSTLMSKSFRMGEKVVQLSTLLRFQSLLTLEMKPPISAEFESFISGDFKAILSKALKHS